MSDAQLLLIRGLPGSGKSTLAKTKYPDRVHLEADMYFSRNGEYKFNPSELPKAHQWCQEETKKALDAGLKVVVTNTFTKLWEMKPYLQMTPSVEVITATGEYPNIHGVPKETIERMKSRWEAYHPGMEIK
jgi:predicted kinase